MQFQAYVKLKLQTTLQEIYWELNYLDGSIAQNMIINNIDSHSV